MQVKVDDADVELPDVTLAIIRKEQRAMPLAKFLSYCIQVGAWHIRHGFQEQEHDFIARCLSEEMAYYLKQEHDLFATRGGDAQPVVRFTHAAAYSG